MDCCIHFIFGIDIINLDTTLKWHTILLNIWQFLFPSHSQCTKNTTNKTNIISPISFRSEFHAINAKFVFFCSQKFWQFVKCYKLCCMFYTWFVVNMYDLLGPSVLIGWIILTGAIVGILIVWSLRTRPYSTWWWLLWLIILWIVLRIVLWILWVTLLWSSHQFWWRLMCYWFWALLFAALNAATNSTSAEEAQKTN